MMEDTCSAIPTGYDLYLLFLVFGVVLLLIFMFMFCFCVKVDPENEVLSVDYGIPLMKYPKLSFLKSGSYNLVIPFWRGIIFDPETGLTTRLNNHFICNLDVEWDYSSYGIFDYFYCVELKWSISSFQKFSNELYSISRKYGLRLSNMIEDFNLACYYMFCSLIDLIGDNPKTEKRITDINEVIEELKKRSNEYGIRVVDFKIEFTKRFTVEYIKRDREILNEFNKLVGSSSTKTNE